MAIDGVSGRTSYLGSSILNLKSQLDTLTQQLASGRKSSTYAGLGIDSGTATGLRAQISSIAGYANTGTVLNTRINVANLSLQGMSDSASQVKAAAAGATLNIDSNGKTAGQKTAMASFTQFIALLNTEVGGRYMFSGRATDTPATESADVILNGSGTRIGLKQIIDERGVADGTSGLGRTVITSATPTSVTIGEDVAGSPFGLKLSAITTTSASATVTGPAPPAAPPGAPSEMSVDLGATNPADGDKFRFKFNLPDGTSETIELTASSATPTPVGSFAIGADSAATAANLNSALNTAVGTLANTALVAASAVAASDNFFSSSPPLRVDTSSNPPVALRNGTPTDTVSWYTGESGTDPARGTAIVGIDQAITVQYGARANEDAFVAALKSIAVYAAVTTNASNPNANGQLTALNSRVVDNLAVHPGTQSIQDIQADFAGAQGAIDKAKDRQTQTGSVAQSMLDSIQGINDNEVATKILALQTALQASYQTTASLYQMSLVKFL
ncbi:MULTISPECIES: flagellar hook protein FlgL [unclassified Afipia]|uniref:flagellar hook protein FlgL n=1 Tax=unclassified Afipia TaxID=2642050 RepID=UPI000413B23C|nr:MULTISPECIES: flagellar hook protein FlgL [unclassified Afipia]